MPSDPPTPFRWGLIGPGGIAQRFAGALPAVPGAVLGAVLARDPAKGQAFAERWQTGTPVHVTTRLDELLADPSLDAVYIATPHSEHLHYARAALGAGKPVLCEKPLVTSQAEGHELVALARERGVFLMEALWTRFLPAYDLAGRWLREGAIGELRAMQSSFCFPAAYDPAHRIWNPALAGGALLDIGIYNLAVTRWALQQLHGGACPEPRGLDVAVQRAPTGVDAVVDAVLHFDGGVRSQFRCGFDAASANAFELLGSLGCLRFPLNFSQGQSVELIRRGQPVERVEAPFALNGFEGQIDEVQACVRAGLVESPRMPHAESLALLGWMDAIRARF
ncbi:MAG: gfo/Idh/MocA family oxidoreductase [Roseateles depolymerans]|uniref:Gfo/Idh/MocA family oxidoreductase n=1 Tax=Roseateles depolymerans TaxID=76731 RepID=A0A2W5FQN2_9BURK|nr:MAG: gfo/Idh/MocA family oxidoreductase [Roseateles depolymerans]